MVKISNGINQYYFLYRIDIKGTYSVYHTITTSNNLEKEAFWKHCFIPFPEQISILQTYISCCLQMLSISLTVLLFGKELISVWSIYNLKRVEHTENL